MTDHLRPEEFVEALDGAPAAAAREHLADCAECRGQLEDLGAVIRASANVEAASPSPLFWDHFSERVRQATTALPMRAPWWAGWWRPAAMCAAAAGAVTLIIVLQPKPADLPNVAEGVGPGGQTVAMAEIPDDGSWSLVVGLASEFNYADVKEATEPMAGTADVMIEELAPAQRAALARLLEKEMGDQ